MVVYMSGFISAIAIKLHYEHINKANERPMFSKYGHSAAIFTAVKDCVELGYDT